MAGRVKNGLDEYGNQKWQASRAGEQRVRGKQIDKHKRVHKGAR